MLLGEHAVLYGEAAIACAVGGRVRVRASARADRIITITSSHGRCEMPIDHWTLRPGLTFACAAVAQWTERLERGADLVVESDLDADRGFGTSGAVVAAVLGALGGLASKPPGASELLPLGVAAVRAAQQGAGSGADVAASLSGGVIFYRPDIRFVKKWPLDLPMEWAYCGYKTPTPEVIRRVAAFRRVEPKLATDLLRQIGRCVDEGRDAIERTEHERLGRIMNIHQGLLGALGVSNADCEALVYGMRAHAGILGAKISGSGLGDGVIGLGRLDAWPLPYERRVLTVEREGLTVEPA
jgi:mevalonate kinase